MAKAASSAVRYIWQISNNTHEHVKLPVKNLNVSIPIDKKKFSIFSSGLQPN